MVFPSTTNLIKLGYLREEGKDVMEQIENQNPVELQVSPEEAAKLLQQLEAEGVVVTTDEAEPTDAERVLN